MMRRRDLLLGAAAMQAPPRPNIVWISCEDSSPMLGCYGDPHAITPNLDAFAKKAVRYTRAYTVAGVCAPSRSGIITGMYPTSLGSSHMRSSVRLPSHVRAFPAYLREAGYYCTNNAKTDYNFPVPKDAWDEVSGKAHWKNRPAGMPFFAVFNIETTHESRYPRRGAEHAKDIPDLKPEQLQDPAKLKTLPPFYPDTPEVRRDWANVYECLTQMDITFAKRLKEIEDAGLAEDTIVFFWGDHGVGQPRCKRWLYETSTHVPLMIRIPAKFRAAGQGKPASVDDQLVSFIDLAPTVLNLAGVKLPAQFQGRAFLGAGLSARREYIHGARDRMDERYDMVRMVRDARYRYIRNYEPEKPYSQYMNTPEKGPTMRELRRLPQSAPVFMAAKKAPEELYDVQADPWELKNLAQDPKHAAVLKRLRAEHERWALDTRDLGLVPEPELVAREKKLGSRYAILRQEDGEALMRRLRAPSATDADPAVRYQAVRQKGAVLEDDPVAIVRIASAKVTKNVPLLMKELENPEDWTRLAAAQALDEIGEAAKPALAALRNKLKAETNNYVIRVLNHTVNQLAGETNEVA